MARCDAERLAIERLADEGTWLRDARWALDGADLCLDAELLIGDTAFSVRMVYPSSFPATGPSVWPRGSTTRWSSHQYGPSGELCLEWGPDTWRSDVLGAQVLESAHTLLCAEAKTSGTPAPVPSRHHQSLGQGLRESEFRFGVPDDLVEFVRAQPEGAKGSAVLVCGPESPYVVFVRSLTVGEATWTDPSLPPCILSGSSRTATFIKSTLPGVALRTSPSASDLAAMLEPVGLDLGTLPPVTEEADFGFLLVADASHMVHLFTVWEAEGERRCLGFASFPFARSTAVRLDPEATRCTPKEVGIVGLGSIGSKIAVALARSGIRRFVLVDDDVVLPENLCRNELDWSDVGHLKVEAVARAIARVSAGVEIDRRRIRLTGQEATAATNAAVTRLAGCDLVIDATACPRTFNVLAHLASRAVKPLVWCEVFEGGIGGFVARSRPRLDPAPPAIRDALSAFSAAHPYPKEASVDPYTGGDDEGGLPRVATDADVALIAAHATQFALDILFERVPSRFPYPLYLVGLARGWVFDAPFSTIPIDAGPASPPSSVLSGVPPEVVAGVTSFVCELLERVDRGPAAPG